MCNRKMENLVGFDDIIYWKCRVKSIVSSFLHIKIYNKYRDFSSLNKVLKCSQLSNISLWG